MEQTAVLLRQITPAAPSPPGSNSAHFRAELPRHGPYPDERWRTRIGGDHLLGVAEPRPPD
ncbi:hypothetical protein [Streptomyces sp. NK08204]|uniref:hypothetical protein n=1 Tax=Streptomyces sp. NK08204 TaxID=2873260 RepID=UPI001CECB964|nr:hypothetical protein [Streptomyces sp. NK08204]